MLERSRSWASFGVQQRRFALGETLTHLKLLAARREVAESGSEPVRWYPADAGSGEATR